jgi:hypothetical protein
VPASGSRQVGLWLFILVLLGLRLASGATANAAFFLLAGYALTGRAQAIQALALSWLFSMLSDGVAPEASQAALGRYAVLAGALISVLLRSVRIRQQGWPMGRLVLLTLLMGAGMVVHALLFSEVRDVSVLKAVSWTMAVTTLLSAWAGLDGQARERLERQLFGGLMVVMLVSLPLLVTNLGYLRNGTGFQGVLNHPQAFGPTVALLAAWLGSRIVAEPRPPWRWVVVFALALVLIVLSEARTAGLGLLLGLGLAAITGRMLARRKLRDYLPGLRSRRVQFVFGVGLLLVIATGPYLAPRLADFLAKRGESSSLAEAYNRSRGAKIDEMLANIREHPLRGIGFGVASDPLTMEVKRDPLLGLPLGASIEKGVVFLAAWEELGLLGFFVVLGWIWLLVLRAARNGMRPLAVCLTALLMNFGEATLFSPSGMGMLSLILISWAVTKGRSRPGDSHG